MNSVPLSRTRSSGERALTLSFWSLVLETRVAPISDRLLHIGESF